MTHRGNAAIVGAGLMGYWHAAALARLGIRVTAIIDPRHDQVRRLLRLHPAARTYADFDEFLQSPRPDTGVVHLCTPRNLHADQIRRSLESGCHVMVEKPLAPSAAETTALLRLAGAHQRQLCPVHQFPFQRGPLRLERVMGSLGTIRHIDFRACSAGGAGRSAAECEEIAADILPHPLSLLLMLLPRDIVRSLAWHSSMPSAGEIRTMGAGSDMTVSILVSMAGRPPRNAMAVIADHGTAYLDLFHGFMVLERSRVSRSSKVLQPFALARDTLAVAALNLAIRAVVWEPAYPGLRELIRRFHAAVATGGPMPIPATQVIDTAIIREQIISPPSGTELRDASLKVVEHAAGRPIARLRHD